MFLAEFSPCNSFLRTKTAETLASVTGLVGYLWALVFLHGANINGNRRKSIAQRVTINKIPLSDRVSDFGTL